MVKVVIQAKPPRKGIRVGSQVVILSEPAGAAKDLGFENGRSFALAQDDKQPMAGESIHCSTF
jgi:hypothetical protein